MLTIIHEENEKVVHSADPGILSGLLAQPNRLFWLDLESPTPEEFSLLADVFHFHPLAIEDAERPFQRAKVDEYDGYFFITADEISLNLDESAHADDSRDADDHIPIRQMSIFAGHNFLVSIHIEPVAAIRDVRARCERNNHLLDKGSDFLLYTLLDTLVDSYFPMMDSLDDTLDDLEDRIIENPTQDILQKIITIKRVLSILRKRIGPLREVLKSLTSREFPCIQDKTLPYFRDVADHLYRIYETVDNYRDLMSGMLDAYLSQVSNQMNRVMQKLSALAAVFMPITFITGVFGMNFADQPWLKTNVWVWILLMIALAGYNFWWFHRRKWV